MALNIKSVTRISMVGILVLWVVMLITNQFNYLKTFRASALAYTFVSLAFSVSIVFQFIRNNKIEPNGLLAYRFVAILGAVIAIAIWLVFLYPLSWLKT